MLCERVFDKLGILLYQSVQFLYPDRDESPCPQGSAACLTSSSGSFDMGQPVQQLELISNDKYVLFFCTIYDI